MCTNLLEFETESKRTVNVTNTAEIASTSQSVVQQPAVKTKAALKLFEGVVAAPLTMSKVEDKQVQTEPMETDEIVAPPSSSVPEGKL